EERVEKLAAYLGIEGGFDGFYNWLIEFSRQLEVPEKMSALGVDKEQIDLLAKMAVEDPSAGGNPIPLTTDITKALYEEII
ncbi:MAG: iron-containing alcohol dehydrogenase, partial [Methylocystaceae bacterium]|nr:iron-containing alcohol dehydrogenase [Methylocystaceae bacterium]